MTIRLGYQIPNFTYPDTPVERLFETVVAQAREAEASGFDTVLVMDHFYQLPGIGPAENAMLECYTTLGALASATSTIQLSALVTGNTYRNPPMLAGEQPTFSGKHYRVTNALNNPRIRPSVPIMLGGSGETKTFRMAAQYADHMNIICNREDLAHKVSVLRQRCEEIGRDPSTLATSYLAFVMMTEDAAQAAAVLERMPEDRRSRVFIGTPEQVAESLKTDVLDAGIDGLTINMIANGHVPGAVTLAGKTLAPLVS